MKRVILFKRAKFIIVTLLAFSFLCGCNGEGEADTTAEDATTPAPYKGDAYDTYIHDALESVSKDAESTPIPGADTNNDRVVVVPNKGTDEDIYVSASEALPAESGVTPTFNNGDSSSLDSTEANSTGTTEANSTGTTEEGSSSSSAPEKEAQELTPDEFEVGTCCIYLNGENDTTYGADIIKAINKARTDLGYPELNEKKGLDTCADRRTRETASFLNHYRPNGTPFYSLAPQYFKAEMLAIDGGKAEETVDAWIADPYSRQLVFTTKYTSFGAACFKCNGLNCVVVAFGY